jgi:sigma-B regulation protein RsbU (phosphoserine phosphatase)
MGGDLYYFAVCDSDLLTRVVLADLRGHGHQVSILSEWIFNALRDSMGSLNGGSILANLNRLLYERGLDAVTTATIVSFYLGDSHLYVANAGHPPVLLRRSDEEVWQPIEIESRQEIANLPLGMFGNTLYHQAPVPLKLGDRLALYTDGFTEGADSRERAFGEDCLRASLRRHGNLDLAGLKDQLVNDLRLHVAGPFEDDVTLLLLEIAQSPSGFGSCRMAER